MTAEELMALQQSVRAVFASPALYDYLQAIIALHPPVPRVRDRLEPARRA